MQDERFEEFMALISGVYRNIQKLMAHRAEQLGLKQVHVFWVYLLLCRPEGLTASELAKASQIDRSLVSREIDTLTEGGYVKTHQPTGRRRYGWKFILTDKGMETALEISRIAREVQYGLDEGIPAEELDAFYRTLRRLLHNFDNLTGGTKLAR